MVSLMAPFADFNSFEARNITFYVFGIMIYKFSLETMNVCLNGIVLNRMSSSQGATWAQMQGINLVFQCIGSLLIGPFVKRFHAKTVLATAILCFAVVALSVPILELSSGGKIPASAGSKSKSSWGSWDPQLIYVIYAGCGLFHGMVELMRRVIPAEILGGDAIKLKRMDSLVHIFYEITGTTSALFGYIWVGYFGWGYAFTILPAGYFLSFLSWTMIQPRPEKVKEIEEYIEETKDVSTVKKLGEIFYSFFHSIYFGGRLILTQRALVWLIPAYTLPLVLHRYLENTLFPFYTKSVLNNSDYQTILTGGSNFGELLGALLVLVVAKHVKTPIPFLRLDVLLLLIVWILPYFPVNTSNPLATAWSLAPLMSLISFGWAAGDVSLAAYVQSRLSEYSAIDKFTTPLGAVMSFLYVTYLVVFYFLNLGMSSVRDNYVAGKKSLPELFILIGGVFMTAAGLVTMISTFIPRGSFAWNPDPDTVDFDETIKINGVELEKIAPGEQTKEDLVVGM